MNGADGARKVGVSYMFRRAGIALALAAILAFGPACPVLAERQDSGLPAFDLPEDALPELPELPESSGLPEAGGIAVDGLGEALESVDVTVTGVASSGIRAANHHPARNALDYAGLPVIETDVASPSEGCVFLLLRGSYVSDVAGALARINEIRMEACQEGVDNPDNPGTPLTMDDYAPIKWSSGLEYVARIRAAEAAVSMGHTRLTDRDIWFSSPSGVRSFGEVIAWNWSASVVYGIDQWYREKADWVNKTPGAVTGHYTQMIQPSHDYVGLGTFLCNDVRYPNTTVGQFSSSWYRYGAGSLDETPMAFTGDCIQKLEVKADGIEGGKLIGTLNGVAGDSSALALAATVRGCTLLVPGDVTWTSSAPGVAFVDASGTVTAASCGVASISADAPGVVSASADFTVEHMEQEIPAVAATCTASGLTAGVECPVCGAILQVQHTVPALGHAFGDWATTQQATVFQTGARQRRCATCGEQQTESIPRLAPKLTLSKSAIRIAKLNENSVKVKLAKGDTFTAKSSNKNIARVYRGSGKLTVKAQKTAGEATITVTTKSGLRAELLVTVNKAKTTKLTCKSVSVKRGRKVTLKPKRTPSYSDDPITFASSNRKIATVSAKGVVKGIRKGKTTIIVRSGKKSVKVKVTVK